MILFIAPCDGTSSELSENIAGSKKILIIINILKRIDEVVYLLDTSYNVINFNSKAKIILDNSNVVKILRVNIKKKNYIEKLMNIWDAKEITEEVVKIIGVPDVVWCYNGYAFEMSVAKYLNEKYKTRNIIEFEDWHFARGRGTNIKPFIDWYYWRRAKINFVFGYAVNNFLEEKLKIFNMPVMLLPGVVSIELSLTAKEFPPFKQENLTIGYFGGLSKEKGAEIILKLINLTNDKIKFIVTGNGELELEFTKMAHRMPSKLTFLGMVSEEKLIEAISKVDIIINAHNVNRGVFPFKVIEALASARLLISTELPMKGYESFVDAIQFYSSDENELVRLINNSAEIYREKKENIRSIAELVCNMYSEDRLTEIIRKNIQKLK